MFSMQHDVGFCATGLIADYSLLYMPAIIHSEIPWHGMVWASSANIALIKYMGKRDTQQIYP